MVRLAQPSSVFCKHLLILSTTAAVSVTSQGFGTAPGHPTSIKSVSFSPMSPKSAQTMQMHRRQQLQSGTGDDESQISEDDEAEPHQQVTHRRRASDTSHDRTRGRGRTDSNSDSDDVELLPNRFDSHGTPLDSHSNEDGHWTNRSGDFWRQPQRPGDWDVRGAWQVGGTDAESVNRLAQGVTNALDGRGSWMNVIGEVLGGGLSNLEQQEPENRTQPRLGDAGGDVRGSREGGRRRRRRSE